MIYGDVIHPELVGALAAAGHGSTVLIADGNYPVATGSAAQAVRVWLNLRPGVLDATTVLQAVADTVPIEAARVMSPGDADSPIFAEFGKILGEVEIVSLARKDFYDAALSRDLAVVIATGERRHFGNILVTIGVVDEGPVA